MAGATSIERVSHIHECIINEMVADPTITQALLCEQFGYTPAWMSRIIGSDSFQARLAERRQQLLDPRLKQQLTEKLESVVLQSMEQIQRKLDSTESADLALESLLVAGNALSGNVLKK